ncbi:beta-ketoacyl synthase N-terminal-like domain-containing protein [Kaarinaea lacus]
MLNSNQSKRVYIRGAGIVCAMGTSQPQLALACESGQVNVDSIMLPQLSDAPIPYYRISESIHPARSNRLYKFLDYAVEQAIADAGLSQPEISNTAVFCGSTACDISDLEEHYANDMSEDPDAMPLYRSGFGILAGYVRDQFTLGGDEYSFNTACSSSANAFITAAHMIAAGRCDHALVLGVEVINQMSLQGFHSMMLLSNDACRPFDADRNGTVLGESVACVVLSAKPPQRSLFCRNSPFYFLGGANLCDTKSVTSSNADVIAEVMQNALRNANISADEVDIIKAHGTSTANNDSAEGQAMQKVFTNHIPPFTSLKPYLGHTLGACGVAEMIVLLASIQQGFIPKTPTFATPDPEFNIRPLQGAHEFHDGVILLNYFGFGGNNTSVLISNR